jgi:hypothetical protein
LTPVRCADFVAPLRKHAEELWFPPDFGFLVVTVRDVDGNRIDGARLQARDPRRVTDVPVVSGARMGARAGIYDLAGAGPFESVAAWQRAGIKVQSGATTEVVIDDPMRWSRCEVIAEPEGDAELPGFSFQFVHDASGIRVEHRQEQRQVSCWVPAGRYTALCESGSAPGRVWRSPPTRVEIRGGTLAAPQMVRLAMRPDR